MGQGWHLLYNSFQLLTSLGMAGGTQPSFFITFGISYPQLNPASASSCHLHFILHSSILPSSSSLVLTGTRAIFTSLHFLRSTNLEIASTLLETFKWGPGTNSEVSHQHGHGQRPRSSSSRDTEACHRALAAWLFLILTISEVHSYPFVCFSPMAPPTCLPKFQEFGCSSFLSKFPIFLLKEPPGTSLVLVASPHPLMIVLLPLVYSELSLASQVHQTSPSSACPRLILPNCYTKSFSMKAFKTWP